MRCDFCSEFLFTDGSFTKNDNNDNKGKDTLILGKEATQRLDGSELTAEAIYPVCFTQQSNRFVLILRFVLTVLINYITNGSNSFLFVNATKTYQFKAKIS